MTNKDGRFITNPGDVFIILTIKNAVVNTISVQCENPSQPTEHFTLSNCFEAWEFMKKLNDMGGRKVLIQTYPDRKSWEPVVIPFEESMPYQTRF